MNKYLVLFLAPSAVLDDWVKRDPKDRQAEEEKMQKAWQQWTADHARLFDDRGAGVGKPKVVKPDGVSDGRNDIMLYATVEADSVDAAARAFADHPHLQIPQSTIEVMELRSHGM